MSRDSFLRHLTAFTWLYLMGLPLYCHAYTIDQIIAGSMTSSDGYSFIYDEVSKTVKVDMDMIFSIDDWIKLTTLNNSYSEHEGGIHKRQAIREGAGGKYWPGGVIYYEIQPYAFSKDEIQMFHEAMNEWMRYTCVKFRPANRNTRNKILFAEGDGCSSNVGMVQDNRVTLSKGCRVRGVVIHELGHVLGFHHEQTRPDRDYYVKINWENIPDHLQYNFRKYTWAVIRSLGVAYDYLSIMHYGKDAFSANGKVTIETRDKKYQELIGNRRGLSFRDIKSANILYNCRPSRQDCDLTDDDCPGEGFVSKNCECWCPVDDVYREVPYYVCKTASGASGTQRANAGSSGAGAATNGAGGAGDGDRGDGRRGKGSDCTDQNKNCKLWASRGECSNNRFYMEAYCRKACGLCDAVTPFCRDEYDECGYWRQKGYCDASSDFSGFMASNCKKSCALCVTGPGKILPCERKCRNDHEHCEMWARRGECNTTPDYMLRHCRKACKTCCSLASFRTRTTSTPKLSGPTASQERQQTLGQSLPSSVMAVVDTAKTDIESVPECVEVEAKETEQGEEKAPYV